MTPPNERRSEQVDPRITALAERIAYRLYSFPEGEDDCAQMIASLLTESGAFAGMGEPVRWLSEYRYLDDRDGFWRDGMDFKREADATDWLASAKKNGDIEARLVPLCRLPQHGDRA